MLVIDGARVHSLASQQPSWFVAVSVTLVWQEECKRVLYKECLPVVGVR